MDKSKNTSFFCFLPLEGRLTLFSFPPPNPLPPRGEGKYYISTEGRGEYKEKIIS